MGYFAELVDTTISRKTIINLWKNFFDVYKNNSKEYLNKKYDWYYNEKSYESGIVYLLKEDKEHKPIGSAGLSIRRFKFTDKNLKFGLIGNLVIQNQYRSLGPAIVLQKEIVNNLKKSFAVLYGFPPLMAEPVIKRAGYKTIGYKKRYSKILKSYRVLSNFIKVPYIIKLLSCFLDLFLKIISKEYRVKPNKKYISENISDFDHRFDALWEKLSKKYTITAIRTSDFLKWRYLSCPYKNYKIHCLYDFERKIIHGYVIYDIIDQDVAKIVDIFVDFQSKDFEILLSSFIKKQRRNRMRSIVLEIFCSQEIQKKFHKYGFKIRFQNIPVMINYDNVEYSAMIEDENMWYLTSGDDNG